MGGVEVFNAKASLSDIVAVVPISHSLPATKIARSIFTVTFFSIGSRVLEKEEVLSILGDSSQNGKAEGAGNCKVDSDGEADGHDSGLEPSEWVNIYLKAIGPLCDQELTPVRMYQCARWNVGAR